MSAVLENEMHLCRACGRQLHRSAVACPGCGAQQGPQSLSEKRILPAFLLCFFFGVLGIHRFYAGKVGTGILQLVTFGGLGIWALIDIVLIIAGVFTDSDGHKIVLWT